VDEKRIDGIAQGIAELTRQPDPIHQVLEDRIIKSGIHLQKISVPLGVIGIIYEARPNVTADCAALCIKSGNACVLKGGKESYETSYAIIAILKDVLRRNGLPEEAVMLSEKVSHAETERFMACREYLDVLIPRGSRRLIQSVVEHAKVPVIETGAGICHVYVEKTADLKMAQRIVINAKCQRPSVCNAMETLLVEEDIAASFLPEMVRAFQDHHVIMYGDAKSVTICKDILPVKEDSFDTEYNDLIVNIGIVRDTEAAIAHIEAHGTHHSDAIITEDEGEAEKFLNGVDSACVYVNASTRFTDGFEFGLGAEIGISTQKLHARGPMGLHALTTYTYHLRGKGEIRK
jgi:glutamate-5-semialdehyde dehydrogenase